MAVKKGYTFHAGDLFHRGHLWQLGECKKHCDYLIVGLLTNGAIASYKRRPIIPYAWRAALYRALAIVDEVVAQDSRDPTDNLKTYLPDILFHGDDWPDMPGAAWMESQGLEVVRTRYFYGITTTKIIEEILRRSK